MKKILLLIAVCTIIATAPSCSSNDSSAPTYGIPEWAGALMQTVPDDIGFAAFLDIETLRTDPDLQAYFTARQDWFYTSSFFPRNVFDFNQLDCWVSCSDGDLITGDLDTEAAKSLLLSNGWVQDEDEGFAMFEKANGWGQLVDIAFSQEFIIGKLNASGNDIIRTINGGQPSIYENSQFQDLMTQLPADSFELSYGDNDYMTSGGNSIRLLAGNAISKLDDDYLRYTYIVTAGVETISDAIVADLTDDLKNYIEAFAQADVDVTRNGSYVTMTADIPISSFSDIGSTP